MNFMKSPADVLTVPLNAGEQPWRSIASDGVAYWQHWCCLQVDT